MNLLDDIQSSVLDTRIDIPVVLLKLRALAASFGSKPLDDWIEYENQGYPPDAELPPYRIVPVSYTATFSGPLGSGIRNAPIPLHLVETFAGESWTRYEVRDSIAAICELTRPEKRNDVKLGFDAANLILLLQGNVYEGYGCNSVTGHLSRTSFIEIAHIVRTKILDFTFALLHSVPSAADIAIGNQRVSVISESDKVTQVLQQIIHGNVTNVSGDAQVTNVAVTSVRHDTKAFVEALVGSGMVRSDAEELAEIVASEDAGTREDPFGRKTKDWLKKNVGKALDGAWNSTLQVATRAITEAVMGYYGLK